MLTHRTEPTSHNISIGRCACDIYRHALQCHPSLDSRTFQNLCQILNYGSHLHVKFRYSTFGNAARYCRGIHEIHTHILWTH